MAKKATGARKTAATNTPAPEEAPEQITPLGEEPTGEEIQEVEAVQVEPDPVEEVPEEAPGEVPEQAPYSRKFYGLWRVIVGRILHFLHDPVTPHLWAEGGQVVLVDNDFLAEQVMRQTSKLNRIEEMPDGEEAVKITRNDVKMLAAQYVSTTVDEALRQKAKPAPLI